MNDETARSPYSPRLHRHPDETDEEWKRRKNREKKARYRERHPERVHAQKNRAYARRSQQIQAQARQNRLARMAKVSAEQLDLLRRNPRDAIREKEAVCLQCGAPLRRLSKHLRGIHRITDAEYREAWGYDRNRPLVCREESAKVAKTAKKRNWQTRLVGHRFKPGRTEQPPDESRSRRPEARQKISESLMGIQRPYAWKQDAGDVVTDVKIAQQRLSGALVEEIAKKFNISAGSISVRLARLGFNSRDVCFERGAPVTGRTVLAICEDFQKTGEEVSDLLGVTHDWASGRKLHPDRPLSLRAARKLLKLREQLRKREMPTTGGRPSKLLPSERSELPGKYRALHGDLKMLQAFLRHERKPTFDRMWIWICRQTRRRHLRTLLFWPAFHRWVQREYEVALESFLSGSWVPSELSQEFLCQEYDVSRRTLESVIFGG